MAKNVYLSVCVLTSLLTRVGHVTTLPRQRNHVFRPHFTLFLHVDTETLTFLGFFSGPLKLYSVVAKPKNCHVPSSDDYWLFVQVSLNCREVVAVGVKDPFTCAKLGTPYNTDSIFGYVEF